MHEMWTIAIDDPGFCLAAWIDVLFGVETP